MKSEGRSDCAVHVTGCVRASHRWGTTSLYSYQGKTLHVRSQESAVTYLSHTTALKEPSHWLCPCPISWLDKHMCAFYKNIFTEEKWQRLWQHYATTPGGAVFLCGRVMRWAIWGWSQDVGGEERSTPTGISWGGWLTADDNEETEIVGGRRDSDQQHRRQHRPERAGRVLVSEVSVVPGESEQRGLWAGPAGGPTTLLVTFCCHFVFIYCRLAWWHSA